MKLNEKIKQTKFASEAEKVAVNVSFTNSYLSGHFNSALKEHNISLQQFNVLRILKGQDPKPVSVNDITQRMVDKMSNASRLVDKLYAKGLVEKKPCSYDKRQVDVLLSSNGHKNLDKLNVLVDDVVNSHVNLNNDELKTLNELLDRFRNN